MPHLLIVSITILPALETVLSFIEKARSPITPLSFAAGKSKIRDKIKPMSLFQYREYLMKVDPILRQKWKIPLEISAKLEVRVKLVLDRKGTILQYAFVDISGNKIFDQSVRDLLNELDKLLPLPEEFEGDFN